MKTFEISAFESEEVPQENGSPALEFERKDGQPHLEHIQNLRSQILQMDAKELKAFEALRPKEMTLMEIDALDSAIKERREHLEGKDKKSVKEVAIDAMSDDEVLKKAGDIFEKVKLSEEVDPVPFAREFLKHEKEIEVSRFKVVKVFKELTGDSLNKAVLDKLDVVISEAALVENPSAVLKLVKNLIQECGKDFEDLPKAKQQQLRNAVVGTSTFAVDFKGKKPAVDALKKTEEGGYLNIKGEYIGKGGAKNPYIDLSPGDKKHLQENFVAITDLSLRKITEYINEPLPEGATAEDIAEKENRIKKGIKSICNQLGQERWWWARQLESSQIENYKNGLDKLDSSLIDKIKNQMIADDVKVKVPAHRAIYNKLFGGYNEVFEEAVSALNQLDIKEAA